MAEPFKPDFTKSNPYAGVPQDYLQQIQGTPAYNQAMSAGWINPLPATSQPTHTPASTSSTVAQAATTQSSTPPAPAPFRPDFTKPNPYEGVTQDYLQQIQGTPAYDQAVNAGWVNPLPSAPKPAPVQPPPVPVQPPPTADTFKPDFTKPDPYAGAPQSYLDKIYGTSAYDQAVKAGWIQPHLADTFKPDYTKANPYEGAPPEYFDKVNKYFVPTIGNPIPPYAGHVVDSEANIFVDETGRQVELRRQDSAEMFFEGIAARAAAKSREILNRDYIKLADDQYMSRTAFADLSPEYQDIAKTQGLEALRKKVEASTVRLADNKLVPLEKWDSLGDKYKHIGLTEGFDKMSEAIASDNKLMKEMQEKLKPYGEMEDGELVYKIGGLARFLRDNPDDGGAKLIQAGFSLENVNDAMKYNRDTRGLGTPDYVSVDDFKRQYFTERGWGESDRAKLLRGGATDEDLKLYYKREAEAIRVHDDKFRPKVSQDEFVTNYFADKGWDYNQKEPQITANRALHPEKYEEQMQANAEWRRRLSEATSAYTQKYGNLALVQSTAAKVGSFVFIPARALAPEVSLKDITGMDWAVGGAQLLTTALGGGALGLAGKGVAKAITTGAGSKVTTTAFLGSQGVFTADVVVNRDKMTPVQLGVSSALLTLPFIPMGKNIISNAIRKVTQPKSFTVGSLRVEETTLGGRVPAGMRAEDALNMVNLGQRASTTAAVDQILMDPSHGITYRITPLQRSREMLGKHGNYAFSVTTEGSKFLNPLKTKGAYQVDVPRPTSEQWGRGVYASDGVWLDRMESAVVRSNERPVIIGIKYDEIKPTPRVVQELVDRGDYRGAQRLFIQLEKEGNLSPGAYETWKIVGNPEANMATVEREIYFVRGTEYKPVKPTATTKIKELGDTTAGNYVIADKDYFAINAKGERYMAYSKGEKIPIVWLATGNVEPKAPGLTVRNFTEFVTEPYQALKRAVQVFKSPPEITIGYGESSLPGMNVIELRKFKTANDYIGKDGTELFNIKRTEVPKTMPENSGFTVIGDLHGTPKNVVKDINSGYKTPIISGSDNPATWRWNGQKQKIVQVGDIVDRGPDYFKIRDAFNRLADEASVTGGEVKRLIGNHELAYLQNKKIPGVDYSQAPKIRQTILEDVATGRIEAATVVCNSPCRLFTHAGVSADKFPEFKGKTPQEVAKEINARFQKAVQTGDYSDPIFDVGAFEGGQGAGGIFWLRTKEVSPESLDLGFQQFVGHTPTPRGIKEVATNFIDVDTGRQWAQMFDRQPRVFHETPYVSSLPTGKLLARPGEGRYVSLELPLNSKVDIQRVRKDVATKFGDKVTLADYSDIGITLKVPENVGAVKVNEVVSQFQNTLKNYKGNFKYQGIMGYPNDKNPSYLVLGLKDDKSLSNFVTLQNKLDDIAQSKGLPKGSFKLQPDINIASIKSTVPAGERMDMMINILKDQPISSTKISIRNLKPNNRLRDPDKAVANQAKEEAVSVSAENSKYSTPHEGDAPDYKAGRGKIEIPPPVTSPLAESMTPKEVDKAVRYEGIKPEEYQGFSIEDYLGAREEYPLETKDGIGEEGYKATPMEEGVRIPDGDTSPETAKDQSYEPDVEPDVPEKGTPPPYAPEPPEVVTPPPYTPDPPEPPPPPYGDTPSTYTPPPPVKIPEGILPPDDTPDDPKTPFIIPKKAGKTTEHEFPPGTITWKQGGIKQGEAMEDVWHVIPPPYNKKYTLTGEYPEGAKNVDAKTPKETVQVIGGPAKDNVKVSLGIQELVVKKGASDIHFTEVYQSKRKGIPKKIKELFSDEAESPSSPNIATTSTRTRLPRPSLGAVIDNRKSAKPPLNATKEGNMYHIRGVGYTRSLKRGRLIE